ncbi:4'-phosphopantetheinyl transferase family protein [Variovorax ureilyticus]|uniref:4'-phosphopantetheinyl transferase family protein n=1 Tax=Variovorax ureilyticus TaxID=1836198 RepID=UPI003D66FA5B
MSIVEVPAAVRCRLWRIDLDATLSAEAIASLSDDEWERAHRFVFAHDRRRFIAAHAALRSTLSAETGIPAAGLDFRFGAFGKPALVEPPGIQFNMSHSKSVGMIAVAIPTGSDSEIGVDVELLRHMPDAEALAETYFTAHERAALAAAAPHERDLAFLRCWTRKESCLKATGLGLSVDTRSFEVGVDGGAREVRIAGEAGLTRLELASFDGGKDLVCAAARVQAIDTPRARPLMPEREACL